MNHSTTARAAILGGRRHRAQPQHTMRMGNRFECVNTLGDTHPAPLDAAHAATYIGADDTPASMPVSRAVFLVPIGVLLFCGAAWALAAGGWL